MTINILWEELTAGLTNQDQLLRVFLRLFAAVLLRGLIGLQWGEGDEPRRVAHSRPGLPRDDDRSVIVLGRRVFARKCLAGNSRNPNWVFIGACPF